MKASAWKSLFLGPALALLLGAPGFCGNAQSPKGETPAAHLGRPAPLSDKNTVGPAHAVSIHAAAPVVHGPKAAAAAAAAPEAAHEARGAEAGTLGELGTRQEEIQRTLDQKTEDVPAEALRQKADFFETARPALLAAEEPAPAPRDSKAARAHLPKSRAKGARAAGSEPPRAAASLRLPSRPAWYTEDLALKLSLGAGLALAAVEWTGGGRIGSASLQNDAMHIAGDRALDALNFFSRRLSRRLGIEQRVLDPVLGFLSVAAIFAMAAFALLRAVHGLSAPPAASAGAATFWLGSLGVLSNMISAALVYPHRKAGVGVGGVFWHAALDALSSCLVMLAGWLAKKFGWTAADPIAGFIVAALIARMGWELARTAWKELKAAGSTENP